MSSVDTDSITLSIPSQANAQYNVTVKHVSDGDEEAIVFTIATPTISDLKPGRHYRITVVVVVNGTPSDPYDAIDDYTS